MFLPNLPKVHFIVFSLHYSQVMTYPLQNDYCQLSHLTAPDQRDAVCLGHDPAAHLEADTEAGVQEAEESSRPEAALTRPEQGEAADQEEDVVDHDVRQGSVIQEIMPN